MTVPPWRRSRERIRHAPSQSYPHDRLGNVLLVFAVGVALLAFAGDLWLLSQTVR